MKEISTKIEREVLQTISSQQARKHELVPYARNGNILRCYSLAERDYTTIIEDVSILSGLSVELTPIDKQQMEQLLLAAYRHESQQPSSDIAKIDNGQNFLMGLIEEAFDNMSSDIHIECYEDKCRIRMRIDGKLIERYAIPKIHYPSLVNQVKILSGLDIAERRLPQDGRMMFDKSGHKFDMRVSTMPAIHGEKVVLRLLTRNADLLDIDNLGMSAVQCEKYIKAIEKPHGMILICGPTGSGKSTTLYATLRKLNKESRNILSVEDPVEYTLEGVNQVQLKEDIGLTFGSALRTFLRQDPDIIMLGEIRDPDTAQMAIRSSLTGHLIFSTIHTNSAWGSVARLTDMGIHPYLIADSLIMCVAQRLVRILCVHCKSESRESLTLPDGQIIKKYYRATGCEKCYYTGYRGRKAIYEVVSIDADLQCAIRSSRSVDNSDLYDNDTKSLYQSGVEMLIKGETSPEEILSAIN